MNDHGEMVDLFARMIRTKAVEPAALLVVIGTICFETVGAPTPPWLKQAVAAAFASAGVGPPEDHIARVMELMGIQAPAAKETLQ